MQTANNFWCGRKVLVTGAAGFIGSYVTEALVARGALVTAVIPRGDGIGEDENLQVVYDDIKIVRADLTEIDDCLAVCQGQDAIMNVAHVDGSTAFKRARPAFIFRQNMLITLHMLEAACRGSVERFLVMSSAEVYAPDAAVPTPESEGLSGLPSQVTDGYAWSKRMSEFAAQVMAREYGLQVAIARPSNVYGPRDHFEARKGRVIPMFIQQAFHADETIKIWGDGEQVRTFLYVEDLARGLLDLAEKHPFCDPVNFGGAEPISIKDLAGVIARLSGRDVKIVCDPQGPSGAQQRTSDTTKAARLLGFTGSVPLDEGLQRTVEAYRAARVSVPVGS